MRLVGFNAGHGTAIWLEGTSVQMVHSFDIMINPYSLGSAGLINALYPGRFVMHAGDSLVTVTDYIREKERGRAPACDLWLVDGAHTGIRPMRDLLNAWSSARNGSTIVADDCHRHWGYVVDAWQRMVRTGGYAHSTDTPRIRAPTTFPSKMFHQRNMGHGGSGFCAGVAVIP